MPMSLLPEALIPHRARMCLIETVDKIDSDAAICRSKVRKTNIFYNNQIQGIYNWFGIEFMAQSVGIYAGYHSNAGDSEVGLLLSVRKFKSTVNYFKLNETIVITAEKSFIEGKIGVFNCSIQINEQTICQARLNTYLPPKEQTSQILTGNLRL